jgi:hypothetical protein
MSIEFLILVRRANCHIYTLYNQHIYELLCTVQLYALYVQAKKPLGADYNV